VNYYGIGSLTKLKEMLFINNYEEGWLASPHIESFCKAQRCPGFINFLIPRICSLGKFYFYVI
jgi:hypothetical protein